MQAVGTQLLAIPIMISFSLLPGAWVAYGFALPTIRWPARLALSGALSPIMLAFQVLLCKTVGIPFAVIPPLLLLLNLPALWLCWRGRPTAAAHQRSARAWLAGGAVGGSFVLYLLTPWYFVTNLRPFAWHALWHTDITYALTRNRLLPEEPELAGLTLAYGWIGHVYWSVVGWSANLPPTITYAISNLLWLLFTCILAYEVARMGLGLGSPASWFSVGLTYLGTNVVSALAWLYVHDWHWQQEYLGDVRYTPLLNKFLGFETMPFAFALLLAVALLSSVAQQQATPPWTAPLILSLTGLGLIYPLLFPVGVLLAGVRWLLLASGGRRSTWHNRKRTVGWLATGLAASSLLTALFLMLVTKDRSADPLQLTTLQAIKPKCWQLLSALLCFTPAVISITQGMIKRTTVISLTVASIGAMALYVAVDLDKLEYKYILAATILLAPLAAAGVEHLLRQWPTVQWGMTFATILAFVLLHQLLLLRVGAQIPANLVHGPQINEQSFWLSLAPSEADAGWTTVIRTQTPANTIVVTQGSRLHVSAFVARALYAPSDADGEQSSGYSVNNRFNLLSWRGYPAPLYEARLAVVKTLYGATTSTEIRMAIQALLALHRPVAIHVAPDAFLVRWLQAEGLGQVLFADATQMVWLLSPEVPTRENHYAVN